MKTNPNTNAKPSKNKESDTNKEPNFSFGDDTTELSDQDLMMIVGGAGSTKRRVPPRRRTAPTRNGG